MNTHLQVVIDELENVGAVGLAVEKQVIIPAGAQPIVMKGLVPGNRLQPGLSQLPTQKLMYPAVQ